MTPSDERLRADDGDASKRPMPLISVVVPTVGHSSLARTLAAVRSQSYPFVETIVVLDRPAERLRLLAMLGEGEKLVVTHGGEGGGTARNTGIRASHGDFIAFCDDDDWWETQKLAEQIRGFENDQVQWSYCRTYFHSGKSTRVLPTTERQNHRSIGDYLVSRPRLLYGDGFIQSSGLLARRGFVQQHPWAEDLRKHQDWDLIMRWSQSSPHPYVSSEVLVHVQQQARGTSVSSTPRWHQSWVWYERHHASLSGRARADFLWTQVLRSALAERSLPGIARFIARIRDGRPHLASIIVGLHGLRESVRPYSRSKRDK